MKVEKSTEIRSVDVALPSERSSLLLGPTERVEATGSEW
jgi:hypothetical protein